MPAVRRTDEAQAIIARFNQNKRAGVSRTEKMDGRLDSRLTKV